MAGRQDRIRRLRIIDLCFVVVSLLATLWVACAEGKPTVSTEVYGSAAVSTSATGRETPSQTLGSTTNLGYVWQQGPHRFNAGYRFTTDHVWAPDTRWQTGWGGQSGYVFQSNSGRFRYNLAHSIRSLVQAGDVQGGETRSTVTGGADLTLGPRSVTPVSFGIQAAQSYAGYSDPRDKQLTLTTSVARQLDPNSRLGLSADGVVSVDRYDQYQYHRVSGHLDFTRPWLQGRFTASAGATRYIDDNRDQWVYTGGLQQHWSTARGDFDLAYDRSVTDTLTELSVQTQPAPAAQNNNEAPAEAITLELQSVSVRDSLNLAWLWDERCERCTLRTRLGVNRSEALQAGGIDFALNGTLSFTRQHTQRFSSSVGYAWQGGADKGEDGLDHQSHRASIEQNYNLRQSFTVFSSLSHRWSNLSAARRSTIRLGARLSLI